MEKTAEEIDLLKTTAEKELLKAQSNLHTVEIEDLELSRKIDELRLQRKTIQRAVIEAKYNVRQLMTKIRILTQEFWRARG